MLCTFIMVQCFVLTANYGDDDDIGTIELRIFGLFMCAFAPLAVMKYGLWNRTTFFITLLCIANLVLCFSLTVDDEEEGGEFYEQR